MIEKRYALSAASAKKNPNERCLSQYVMESTDLLTRQCVETTIKEVHMTDEGRVKKQVKDLLTKYKAWYFMPVSNGFGVHGIPDFVGCYKERFFGIETKKAGGKPTALQLRQKELIEAAYGKWFLVSDEDSLREVEKWLMKIIG